jgi:alpha-tubulin suppressor-like RCC1 family protein
MFTNQAKRGRTNYEEMLADSYTNNLDVSPGGGHAVKKRRPTTGSLPEEKRGYFQQFMEGLTQSLKDSLAATPTSVSAETIVMIAAEYERARRQIALYDPPTGDPMACGSDEALALGITEDAEQNKSDDYPPTFCLLPSGTPDIVQVCAGGMHSAVLTVDGRVLTFGQNDDGALGRHITEDDLHLAGEVQFPPGAHGRIIQVDAGDNFTLFLTMEGKVYICGTMKDVDSGKFAPVLPGQSLQNGTVQATPIEMTFPQLISKISAGDNAAAALGVDGTLYTFGETT